MVHQASGRLSIACIGIVALALLFSAGCENDIRKVKLVTTRKVFPTQSARNIDVLYSDSAIVKVRLTAPLLENYENENSYREFKKGLKAYFFTVDKKVNSTLSANYAISRDKQKVMEAKGNVVMINEKNERLDTEHLIWDQQKEKIYTKEFVKITTPDKVIFGQGFEANQAFTSYKIFNIKGTINVNKENAPGT